MEINTNYFGKVTYTPKDVVQFAEGLFGFPDQTSFLPISFDHGTDGNDGMICLQSIDDENISFILMNPFGLLHSYSPVLAAGDIASVNGEDEADLSYYAICVMKSNLEDSTVNLKCPIVVNTKNRQAKQVILDDPLYTFRHPLKEFLGKED